MKSLIFKTILPITILVLGLVVSGFANDLDAITTNVVDKTITLSLEDRIDTQLEVKIVDQRGIELLKENFHTKNTKQRRYNLKNLPRGTYTLEIDDFQKKVIKYIKVDFNKVAMGKEVELYKPSTNFKNGSWNMTLLSQSKNVTVSIFNNEGEELLKEKYNNMSVVNKSFNLNKLDTGIYNIKVAIGGEYYSYQVAKI